MGILDSKNLQPSPEQTKGKGNAKQNANAGAKAKANGKMSKFGRQFKLSGKKKPTTAPATEKVQKSQKVQKTQNTPVLRNNGAKKPAAQPPQPVKKTPVRITALGGINEIFYRENEPNSIHVRIYDSAYYKFDLTTGELLDEFIVYNPYNDLQIN